MTTTIIKNTHIKELMEVASGNMQVLEKMTEEFRRLVQKPFKRAERPKRNFEFALESPAETGTHSQQKLTVAGTE
jgi:hypothetical protein